MYVLVRMFSGSAVCLVGIGTALGWFPLGFVEDMVLELSYIVCISK